MRRDDALLAGANLALAAFLVVAGPSMAIAAAEPGGSHGNGGNSGSGKSGGGQSSSSHGNSGNGNSGNSGSGSRGNSGGNASKSKASSNGNGNGNGNGNANGGSNASSSSNGNTTDAATDTATSVASGQSNSGSNIGSNSPAVVPPVTPVRPPVPVIVAEQHTGTVPAARTWAPVPGVAIPPVVEVRAPAVPSQVGAADLLSAGHTQIPVWAAAEPVEIRGDLFGLAGLVLMPLVGLAVGYRQAKAARDADLTIRR